MTQEKKYRMVTPHSDEFPELGDPDSDSSSGGPIAAYSTEGSALSDLNKPEYSIGATQRVPGHKLRPTETLIEEEIYIPDVD